MQAVVKTARGEGNVSLQTVHYRQKHKGDWFTRPS